MTVSLSSAQEIAFDAKQSSVACRTADQTAQYIAASFVGRHDTIGDHKGSRTDMVCDQTDGYVLLHDPSDIRASAKLTYLVYEVP